MVFSSIGIYTVNNSSVELNLAALFGALGFIWIKLGCPAAPMLLGFVLGPMLEENLRRAMLISRGDPSVFFTRPISLAFIIVTFLIVLTMALPAVRKRSSKITG
jgi:putative tricarboxylic transport membrane protein